MKKFYTLMALFVCLFITEQAYASVTCNMQAANTTATWVNELNSTAQITVDSNGNVTGTYKDGSGSGATGPIVGFCNGNAIAFSVAWNGFPTITSWSGTWKNNQIVTLWYLVNGSSSAWNNTNAGTDTFTKK